MSRKPASRPSPPPRRDTPRRDAERDPERIIPVVVMGLGDIGRAVAQAALGHPRLSLVGVVDLAPQLHGRTLDELGVTGTRLRVEPTLAAVAAQAKGGAVLLCTSSKVEQVASQLEEAFRARLSVISTCEELTYPWLYHAEIAERLEAGARKAGVQVLGTGVNPGFVLDRLVATAAALIGEVRHVFAERVVDVRRRRPALQRKVGAGISEAEFDALAERDAIGHVGLAESCALAALGVGLDVDEVEEELTPVIAEEDVTGGAVPVKAGQVAGVFQRACGFVDGTEVVRVELTIAAGAEPVGDRIRIQGEPAVELEVKGGYPGDQATAWAVVNAVPSVVDSEPGLLTVLDLPAGR
jgi:2,4-diaminopentanoate dehydrogenase